ncbi:phosphoribosylamine--glycine ligase [Chitinispirillales bacterium ANBcel5]|uniref:phosphoribosylamine--glycine ligase n=1 Tax=Cellulosispirillum alkaliphilum TaxID=3039283 RepID=UPI002A589145|nr:phosphoribosylamine--glycine ligase [Chitinispirillales bacterium ANBcel5]
MNSILIVGAGGREHAILKALLRSDRPLCMYAYPGNPGMEKDGCMLVDKKINNWDELADWARDNEIDLTVVGPEIPLVEGIVDSFKTKGLTIFGPSKDAARIEGSKAFSKELMKKYQIPTAEYDLFSSKSDALRYLEKKGAPIVIKVSGLAAGKGAIVCNSMEEAKRALDEIFDAKSFGSAGETVVIEEKMEGEEASVFVLTDGKTYRILPVSQDHKAIGEKDTGPNTGGMGAYAPAPVVDNQLLLEIEQNIVVPTIRAMDQEGSLYKGLLYVGIMITKDGPRVVEYNCRFGDPETQAVLPLVSCDWYEVFKACALGNLATVKWSVSSGYCVAVVLASKGYPGEYEKGKPVTGIEEAEQTKSNIDVYHAGTAFDENEDLITNGGRVLAVSAWAETLIDAIGFAYEGVAEINFEGKVFRRDIAAKGLTRLKKRV